MFNKRHGPAGELEMQKNLSEDFKGGTRMALMRALKQASFFAQQKKTQGKIGQKLKKIGQKLKKTGEKLKENWENPRKKQNFCNIFEKMKKFAERNQGFW